MSDAIVDSDVPDVVTVVPFTVNVSPVPVVPPAVLVTDGQLFFQRALPTSTHAPLLFL